MTVTRSHLCTLVKRNAVVGQAVVGEAVVGQAVVVVAVQRPQRLLEEAAPPLHLPLPLQLPLHLLLCKFKCCE